MVVGITGGIGSGKSYVCRRIEAQGFFVYDCDKEAKRLMTVDAALVQAVKELVGEDAYQNGSLNKPVVAQFLFGSAHHAAQLNAIVHPAVRHHFQQTIRRQTAQCVFMESAILFESHFDTLCDYVVCVTAPLSLRLERVTVRDHCTREAVEQRMEQQLSDDEVRQRADFIIVNDGIHCVDKQLKQLIKTLNI